MKVVAINGSPHGEKGNTALILNPFLEGLKAAGAEVRVFLTQTMTVHPCQGEHNCWFQTPGRCFQEDDMQTLLPELAEANVLVLATPLYVDGMTGPLKIVVDRLIPLGDPKIEMREDHCRHPGRSAVTDRKMVLVSNCGFWELDNFDALVGHVKAIAKKPGRTVRRRAAPAARTGPQGHAGLAPACHGRAGRRTRRGPPACHNRIDRARNPGRLQQALALAQSIRHAPIST